MINSKIATIVYANYSENVDMLNSLFKQSELDALVRNDKDILRVEYYFNKEFIGNKVYSEKQAIAQVLKINTTIGKIEEKKEAVYGVDWHSKLARNEKKDVKISELHTKIEFYKSFISEDGFNNSMLPIQLCCNWEDFTT